MGPEEFELHPSVLRAGAEDLLARVVCKTPKEFHLPGFDFHPTAQQDPFFEVQDFKERVLIFVFL